jgi:hypothetical protein
MRRRIWIAAMLLGLAALPTDAQTSSSPQGRIVGTVVNDAGEPIREATLCTRITHPNGSTNSCGSAQTDENGAFQISQIPFGSVGVYAEAVRQGYWRDDETARTQMVALSAKAPTAHVALKIGPRPGELIVSVTDKTTGKAVDSFFVRLIADTTGYCSGVGNFTKQPGTSGVRVPIGTATDVLVEVSAKGYKNWFYSDPASPSRPVLRLESGEERSLEVQLEPK